MKWGIENKIQTGFGLALLILVTVSALAYLSLTRLITANLWVAHTHEVLAELESILNALDHSESGERGYLVTGDEHYLSDYQAGSTEVYLYLQRVKDLTQDNPNQQQRIEYLKPRVDERLAILKEALDVRREQGFEAAKQIVASGRGAQQMTEIRRIVTEMENEENSLLARRVQDDEASTRNTIWTIAAFILAAFALLGIGGYLINRDFSGRRRAEATIADQASLLELTRDAIMVRDLDGTITFWNRGAEEMYGWTRLEAVGKKSHDILKTQFPKPLPEIEGDALRDGRWEGELIHVHRDGRRVIAASWWALQKRERGSHTVVLEINSDITSRKQADQDLQRVNKDLNRRTLELETTNKELEAFTYSVSHDLRAPLRHIDGFSKLLAEESNAQLSGDAREYITLIRESTSEMGHLVDDLLNLARVGRIELSLQATGLNAVVDGVLDELKRSETKRTIEWRVQKLPFVDCDPGLMKQVFTNLLSNSVKFTRPREQAVIEVGTMDRDGESTIFVRDNGVGFSMKHADKLFRVFQRLHRQEDFEGTGVGLATIQRIIHKHGGRVWAESELNHGATFYFSLGGPQNMKVKTQAV